VNASVEFKLLHIVVHDLVKRIINEVVSEN
jgi:hypothetical protein